MINATAPVIELTPSECASLLGARSFGRLAVSTETGPVIFPVNYGYEHLRLVIRSAAGTKMRAAPLTQVCFEIDEVDESVGRGWSVVVKGFARDISTAVDEASVELRHAAVIPLAPGNKERWLQIEAEEITGRRFGSLPEDWPAT
jgi:nitroimidazol reductase NimA-like FMN-containing flavoprotein (pyridoxamine 5'-phosphate oxidase superfamily)